ncbi:MAG: helix-turn-helix transcriptional regulator [Candidatus Acidiferrum sp.]
MKQMRGAAISRVWPGPGFQLMTIVILYDHGHYTSRENMRPKRVSVDWKRVGRRIREVRGLDLTQAELAERIGVSQSYLSIMEHGEGEIGAEVLLAISREFGKSIEWLLTGEE